MIIYKMKCPVHKVLLTADSKHLVRVKESEKGVPIFYCAECNRYYLHSTEIVENPSNAKKKYKNSPVFYTSNERTVLIVNEKTSKKTSKTVGETVSNAPGEKPKERPSSPLRGSSIWKQEISDQRNAKPVKLPSNVNENGEKIIRIHRLSEEEIDQKLMANFNNIRRDYPDIVTDQMSINALIKKVFPSGFSQKIVVRNETFMGNKGTPIKRVEIYNRNSSYLNHRLPEGVYLSFGGRVTNGEFLVTELRLWENPILKEDDTIAEVKFAYDGPNHTNWLYDVTAKIAKHSDNLKGELADWNEYLDWKRQLAELRIRGLKYIGFRFDVDEREMTFLVVSEGKENFDEFKKFLRRNDVSVFSNNYSNNRWYFEFNREYQDFGNSDSGVALTFNRIGATYGVSDIDRYSWDGVRSFAKKYSSDRNDLNTRFMVSGINQSYAEPYMAELVFEISEKAMAIMDRQIRRKGAVDEDIEETFAEEFYGDGYIATSQIGDFALLRRLKTAVHDLANGKTASQGLDQWLFDITKARKPENIEKITYWQNDQINDKQKEAVEKILSVPDICLIQGPPGTGKTTVIAEAIYQFVVRNKRVLVASQANLAVDNALERLISNPKIRAIRLGSAKKIDSSVSNITEGNVLETFYDSILKYIDRQYIGKWNRIDAIREGGHYDYQRYLNGIRSQKELDSAIKQKQAELATVDNSWNTDEEYAQQNEFKNQKVHFMLLNSFCSGNIDNLELMLDKQGILALWPAMEPVLLAIDKQGIRLTRVGVDQDDLETPQRISRANEIIKYVLINAQLVPKLIKKLNSSEQFGGGSRELEELKIREQLLKEKVLKDSKPEDMTEWLAVNKKIAEFNDSGMGLTEAEQNLFHAENMDSMEEEQKKAAMLVALNSVVPLIQMLVQDVQTAANKQIEEISDKQKIFDNKSAESEQKKTDLKSEIEKLEEEKLGKARMAESILRKYKATHETLKQAIDNYIESAEKSIKVSVEREEWEGIFRGLQNWVHEIPDYAQEKEVYLKDFINGCNVVGVSCTENTRTLTENGFDDFDVVIIDEVSKATPPELLIPMLRGRKVVLVGDHRQLPPLFNEHEKTYQEVAEQQEGMEDVTVQLTMADFNKYKDMVTASLFERYFENAPSTIKETLSYQYRMHFDIMDIINIFYDKYLRDGNEDNYTYDTKAHYLNIRSTSGTEMIIPERHAYWFDSSVLAGEPVYEQRKPGSTSAENLVEAEMIMELLKKMERQYANRSEKKALVSIGVISFYYDQVALIRQMIRAESFHAIDVEVNTVDRFQGKEKEIIFVSLVRNVRRAAHNLDSHIAAFQRINVAFSRAQNLLIIVGAKDMYVEQPVKITDMNNGEEKVIMAYREIIEMLDQKGTYFTGDEILTDVKADEILQKLSGVQGGNEV